MSIIYDALQKTQKNREYLRSPLTPPQAQKSWGRRWKWIFLTILALVLGVLSGVFVAIYMNKRAAHLPVASKPQTLHRVAEKALQSQPVPLKAPLSAETTLPKTLPISATAEVSPQLNQRLTLNGVLITDGDKIALINNQSYHLGDMIEGMRIVGIELNTVRLQEGQKYLELRV